MNQIIQYLLKITPEENKMLLAILKHFCFPTKIDFFRHVIRSTYDKINDVEYCGVMNNLKKEK